MAAHGKTGMELMGKRQDEKITFTDLAKFYNEVMGKQASTKQANPDSNATAMVRQMVKVLENAQKKPVDKVSKLLGNGVNHNVREAAVVDYALRLYKLCVELGLSAKHKSTMDIVRGLFLGERRHK